MLGLFSVSHIISDYIHMVRSKHSYICPVYLYIWILKVSPMVRLERPAHRLSQPRPLSTFFFFALENIADPSMGGVFRDSWFCAWWPSECGFHSWVLQKSISGQSPWWANSSDGRPLYSSGKSFGLIYYSIDLLSASLSTGFNVQDLVQRLGSEFREKNSLAENLMWRIVKWVMG